MEAIIVVFYLPPKTPQPTRNKFTQKLYGQAVSSWGGKYRYRKVGFLDGIPFRQLHRGVILVRGEDLSSLLDFFKNWDAIVEVREVIPLEEDLAALGIEKQ